MLPHRLTPTALVLLAIAPLPTLPLSAAAQQPEQSAHDLVRDVMYNELHDREHDSHWEYRSHCVSADKNLVREQVETDEGPVFRVLLEDGAPLDKAQQQQEDERLADYIHDRGKIAHVRREHQEDEQRLADLIGMVPQAFLFSYDAATSGDIVRLAFRPDPAYSASGYEARIIHALTGTITIDVRRKRMIDMNGVIGERVDFGYGFLGHVEKGGTFEIHRRQVSPRHWKTDLVDVHIQGKLLMFKTVGKDQREARSDFRPVPADTTLAAAQAMLGEAATRVQSAEATLVPPQ